MQTDNRRTRFFVLVFGVALFFCGGISACSSPLCASEISPRPGGPTAPQLTFYVAPSGNDRFDGSPGSPWRTIQKAADTLAPGQTAIVMPGNYPERVSITRSGAATAPIALRAANAGGVRMKGFDLTGSYWILNGFDISTQTNGSQGYGIHISGLAGHDVISANYIHELCRDGIRMESTTSSISVLNNRIWRAEMSGIRVDGAGNVIKSNEIWDTLQKPVAMGGIFAGCVTPSGSDADGMRFFGQSQKIVSNYIHDIQYGTATNPDPHTDCFQTWGSAAGTVDAIVIERNLCRWGSPLASANNEAASVEGSSGPVGTVTIRNNVFLNMHQGTNVGRGVRALKVLNNTWSHIALEAVIFHDSRTRADEIVNNIFYDVGGGNDSYACIPGGDPLIAGNDFFLPNGVRPGSYCSNAPFVNLDPMFVALGDSAGNGADYHLRETSPIRGVGIALQDVPDDYDGAARPVGVGCSIGAFEK